MYPFNQDKLITQQQRKLKGAAAHVKHEKHRMAFLFATLSRHRILNIGYRGAQAAQRRRLMPLTRLIPNSKMMISPMAGMGLAPGQSTKMAR